MRTKQDVAQQMKDESSETLPKGFFFPPQLEVLKVGAFFFSPYVDLVLVLNAEVV